MPGKSTDLNIPRVFTHLQLPSEEQGTRVLVALDLEKAFGSVAWPYMTEVLKLYGFGPLFCEWIQLLYQKPVAQIKLGGTLSSPFPVERGTQQGCPLSPTLFSLMVESIAVRGVQVGSLEEKLEISTLC